ncbi:MAG TPA: hypothetical protein VK978_01625 [Candidatus Saccharimonadales bacterium]|nr:hypothetical protein [Candidatus Saccharimonadales bacterium]
MSDLERSGLIEDPAVAHEQAIAADPHMTAAIGHLVVASERHAAYHRYSVGMAPFPAALAPFQSFREHRQVVKATASVRAAYEATADIN